MPKYQATTQSARIRRRRREPQTSFASEVVTITLLSAGLAGIAVVGISQKWYWLTGGGLVGLLVLLASFVVYKIGQAQPGPEIITQSEPAAPAPAAVRTIRVTAPNGDTKEIRRDLPDLHLVSPNGREFTFAGRQIQLLCLWRETGKDGGGIRRDTSTFGFGFDNLEPPILSERYSMAAAVLEECGYVARNGARLLWTEEADRDIFHE